MGLLACILLTIIAAANCAQVFVMFKILKCLLEMDDQPKPEEAAVTDPFQKPKEIYASTNHIVVPKTPTEIRNQNFDKIKEGVEYGSIVGR